MNASKRRLHRFDKVLAMNQNVAMFVYELVAYCAQILQPIVVYAWQLMGMSHHLVTYRRPTSSLSVVLALCKECVIAVAYAIPN